MKIIVKTTKVLKEGTNKYGDWKLVAIVTSDDTKYTTLAEGADAINAGSMMDISDMDENEKGKSFKKYKILEEGQVPVPPATEAMTPGMWDEKDRLQTESIEAQVAFKGVIELMACVIIEKDDALGKAALAWARDRLSAKQPEPPPQPTSAISSLVEDETEPPTLVTPDTLVKLEKRIVDAGYTSKEATSIISEWKWPKITTWSKLTEDQAIVLIEYLGKNPKKTEPEDIPF